MLVTSKRQINEEMGVSREVVKTADYLIGTLKNKIKSGLPFNMRTVCGIKNQRFCRFAYGTKLFNGAISRVVFDVYVFDFDKVRYFADKGIFNDGGEYSPQDKTLNVKLYGFMNKTGDSVQAYYFDGTYEILNHELMHAYEFSKGKSNPGKFYDYSGYMNSDNADYIRAISYSAYYFSKTEISAHAAELFAELKTKAPKSLEAAISTNTYQSFFEEAKKAKSVLSTVAKNPDMRAEVGKEFNSTFEAVRRYINYGINLCYKKFEKVRKKYFGIVDVEKY